MSSENSKNIIWLASYPKSGNTWFRVFLTNLQNESDEPADINKLNSSPIASSRTLFDEATGLSSGEMTFDEIDNLRPEVYEYLARKAEKTVFHKIHDAYTCNLAGEPIIPESATKGVLYFIRNPLDVAVSFAHHSSTSIDKMIESMNSMKHSFCSRSYKQSNQLRQKLLSWSAHVTSWTEESPLPVHVVRYEDMLYRPEATFAAAMSFAGLKFSREQIQKALRFSNIKELQRQEKKKGFKEKAPGASSFFRKGSTGDWQSELTTKQAEKIIEQHNTIMKRFGYLDKQGNPVTEKSNSFQNS